MGIKYKKKNLSVNFRLFFYGKCNGSKLISYLHLSIIDCKFTMIISLIVCSKRMIMSKSWEEENENLYRQERLIAFLQYFEREIIKNKLFHSMTVSDTRKIFQSHINII